MRFSSLLLFFLLVCCNLATGIQEPRARTPETRRRGLFVLNPFRLPFMRVLGMMSLPLLPIILLRQLLISTGSANQQGSGAGAGMGSLGALGILGPFGAGAGFGGFRPGLSSTGGLAHILGIGSEAGTSNAGAPALFVQKRSSVSLLGALERMVEKYDLAVPDCQRRIVCELHRITIKPSLDKLLQTFGWKLLQSLRDKFWDRWNNEYLHHLQSRTKWTAQNPNLKVTMVGVVEMKTSTSVLKRAINKVVPLPFPDNPEDTGAFKI